MTLPERSAERLPRLVVLRRPTHGNFARTAAIADAITSVLQQMPNWPSLGPVRRQALTQIAVKLARIGCGDPGHADHWHDIAGYAELALGEPS